MLFWNVEFLLKESFETQWVKIRHLYINKLPGNTEESCAPSGCLNWDLAQVVSCSSEQTRKRWVYIKHSFVLASCQRIIVKDLNPAYVKRGGKYICVIASLQWQRCWLSEGIVLLALFLLELISHLISRRAGGDTSHNELSVSWISAATNRWGQWKKVVFCLKKQNKQVVLMSQLWKLHSLIGGKPKGGKYKDGLPLLLCLFE